MTMKHEEAWNHNAQIGTTMKPKLKLKQRLQTGQDAHFICAQQGTEKIELRSSPKGDGGTSARVGDQIQRQADAPASETPIKNFDQLPPLLLTQSMFNDSGDEEWFFEKQNQQTGHESTSSKRFKTNLDEAMPGSASRTL